MKTYYSRSLLIAFISLLALMMSACTRYRPGPAIAIAERKMVSDCVYLDTLYENSDMGRIQLYPKYTYDAQEYVLKRADKLGATHIVWLYNYPSGSAAQAYQCPQRTSRNAQ